MAFQKLKFQTFPEKKMVERSRAFLLQMKQRRTIRDFSDKTVPLEIIKNVVSTAASAPSGANKQPWHFVIVQDPAVKTKIRIAAEKEEKEFYAHRASKDWLEDLNQFGTDWHKPFLETAPYLIVVFKKNYDFTSDGKRKNYYVNESVGVASGFLLAALHNAGLATLTHTPSPMEFLENILNRSENEKAVLLIPVGYPADNAEVPILTKESFNRIATIV
ncbi:uncharacterized protein METZ01_LOCUS149888 [marine metagenome]|uniref:Nitroreductase domain-containing protein n=1 Tax=marine metagenome TaxID=408172 RepID=A0A382A6I2_9ZZZZ